MSGRHPTRDTAPAASSSSANLHTAPTLSESDGGSEARAVAGGSLRASAAADLKREPEPPRSCALCGGVTGGRTCAARRYSALSAPTPRERGRPIDAADSLPIRALWRRCAATIFNVPNSERGELGPVWNILARMTADHLRPFLVEPAS
jgi:hypothetical protein